MSNYEKHWQELNAQLHELESRTGDLRAVFTALYAHQLGTGFIRDDLDSVQRFSFCHPETDNRCLRIQFNPVRATRFGGAGIQSSPAHVTVKHDGCFLCPANIHWQQQGRQFGYDLEVNSRPFIAWMNPFPLLPGHLVLASKEHVSQEWSLHSGGQAEPGRILADVVELVARAPGYAGFYNGVNAGASIPEHLHYQLFRPPESHRHFPLELEAITARKEQPGNSQWHLGQYPVESMHWHGEPAKIIETATRWIDRWAANQERLPELTANILAISEERGGEVSLFFVPRDRKKRRVSGMSEKVGGLEVLGELVFSSAEEQDLLESGQLDYFALEQVLAEIYTPLNMP